MSRAFQREMQRIEHKRHRREWKAWLKQHAEEVRKRDVDNYHNIPSTPEPTPVPESKPKQEQIEINDNFIFEGLTTAQAQDLADRAWKAGHGDGRVVWKCFHRHPAPYRAKHRAIIKGAWKILTQEEREWFLMLAEVEKEM